MTNQCSCITETKVSQQVNYKVTVSPSYIHQEEQFTIVVKTMLNSATGTVLASTSNTLTLNDASGFPTSGNGKLRIGNSIRTFSWSGKSGNQLTGVYNHGNPARGTYVQLRIDDNAVNESYNTPARILAITATKEIVLNVAKIESGDWNQGVATITNYILDSSAPRIFHQGVMTATIYVLEDLAPPCIGMFGSATILYELPIPVEPLISSIHLVSQIQGGGQRNVFSRYNYTALRILQDLMNIIDQIQLSSVISRFGGNFYFGPEFTAGYVSLLRADLDYLLNVFPHPVHNQVFAQPLAVGEKTFVDETGDYFTTDEPEKFDPLPYDVTYDLTFYAGRNTAAAPLTNTLENVEIVTPSGNRYRIFAYDDTP